MVNGWIYIEPNARRREDKMAKDKMVKDEVDMKLFNWINLCQHNFLFPNELKILPSESYLPSFASNIQTSTALI